MQFEGHYFKNDNIHEGNGYKKYLDIEIFCSVGQIFAYLKILLFVICRCHLTNSYHSSFTACHI